MFPVTEIEFVHGIWKGHVLTWGSVHHSRMGPVLSLGGDGGGGLVACCLNGVLKYEHT